VDMLSEPDDTRHCPQSQSGVHAASPGSSSARIESSGDSCREDTMGQSPCSLALRRDVSTAENLVARGALLRRTEDAPMREISMYSVALREFTPTKSVQPLLAACCDDEDEPDVSADAHIVGGQMQPNKTPASADGWLHKTLRQGNPLPARPPLLGHDEFDDHPGSAELEATCRSNYTTAVGADRAPESMQMVDQEEAMMEIASTLQRSRSHKVPRRLCLARADELYHEVSEDGRQYEAKPIPVASMVHLPRLRPTAVDSNRATFKGRTPLPRISAGSEKPWKPYQDIYWTPPVEVEFLSIDEREMSMPSQFALDVDDDEVTVCGASVLGRL